MCYAVEEAAAFGATLPTHRGTSVPYVGYSVCFCSWLKQLQVSLYVGIGLLVPLKTFSGRVQS